MEDLLSEFKCSISSNEVFFLTKIHDISCRVCFEMSASSRILLLDFLEKMVHWFLRKDDLKTGSSGNAVRVKAMKEILEIIRLALQCCFLSPGVPF